MEERHGNEEHVKMTEMVLGQLNSEMDNLRMSHKVGSLKESMSGSVQQPQNSGRLAQSHLTTAGSPLQSRNIQGYSSTIGKENESVAKPGRQRYVGGRTSYGE